MNISAETVKQLDFLYIWGYADEMYNDVPAEKATILMIHYAKTDDKDEPIFIAKSFKAPMKQPVTLEWVQNKLGTDRVYKSLADTFQKLLGYRNLNVYPTTYGIGVFVLFNFQNQIETAKTEIEMLLNDNNITYSNEFSEAGWVYRYKISKSAENVKRIEDFLNKQK